jgi:hypothetical protein
MWLSLSCCRKVCALAVILDLKARHEGCINIQTNRCSNPDSLHVPETMPSNKKNTRAAQLVPQAQPTQSDYDTDTANVTDALPPSMAPPPARTNTELNLLVLKRYVPNMERIISIAPFAVVYLFSPETQQWEKSGVEGTLFVCQLSGGDYPRYNVVILNRKSMDNFITELVSGEYIEITEQYVILQVMGDDGSPNIYGLWIFSEEGDEPSIREVVANAIQECAVRAEISRGSVDEDNYNDYGPEPYNLDSAVDIPADEQLSPAPQQSSSQQIDLLSLFSKPSVPATSHNKMAVRPNTQYSEPQPARFTPSADTNFFRSSNSPATVQQQGQRPSQPHALLDLFKSAKNA